MINKKNLSVITFVVFTIWISFLFGVFSVPQVSAAGTQYWCAEKTTSGAWCQNVPLAQVDTNYRRAQTSCQSTSFCKLGTCVNSNEGSCRPNVPQRVCQDSNGVWINGPADSVQQCRLGCCIVGEQAAFVTETACKGLASLYGVNNDFRPDIRDQTQCVALSNPSAKGACVVDDGFVRDCKVTTKGECNKLQTPSGNKTIEFDEGFLCTAETLATRCAPTTKTTCVDGKFGVYYLDSCGNIANIYDASKKDDKEYWTHIKELSKSCNPDLSNAGDAACGNCDYLLGSNCKPYQRGNSQTPTRPELGDYICADLSCNYKGQKYQHGEEWCADSPGLSQNVPGSESYLSQCYNGEVTTTQCGTGFRSSICRQNTSNADFKTASCVVNEWQNCVGVTNKADCEDSEKGDCKWVLGAILNNTLTSTTTADGACVPLYAPGLNFWNDTTKEAETACFTASQACVVKFSRTKLDAAQGNAWKCTENCQCLGLQYHGSIKDAKLDNPWSKQQMGLCLALGDCGSKTNYVQTKGYLNESDIVKWTSIS